MSTPLIQDGPAVVVAGSGNTVNGTITLSPQATAVLVLVGNRGGTGTTGVTVGGVALTQLVAASPGYQFSIWGKIGPPTGAGLAVVVTNSGGPTFSDIAVVGYQNATAFGATVAQPGPGFALATGDASLIVFGAFWNDSSGSAPTHTAWPNYITQLGYTTSGVGGGLSELWVGSAPGDSTGPFGFAVNSTTLTTLTSIAMAAVELQ